MEVSDPRARILAVDDEPVVLDSFRKILVLAGFDVDTVESGPEALGLVQRRDYDFVFTDLKMPGMDGVEVVKAVRHLRPDVDVAVITGYGTIETAVQTMQHGAVDYVQKPFTEDELLEFARKLLLRRQARLEAQREPSVRIVAPGVAESAAVHEYCVPGGAFVSDGHTWARIEPSGELRAGLDDFARKALGRARRRRAAAAGPDGVARRAAVRREPSREHGALRGSHERTGGPRERRARLRPGAADAEPLRKGLGVRAPAEGPRRRAGLAPDRRAGGRLVPGRDRAAAPDVGCGARRTTRRNGPPSSRSSCCRPRRPAEPYGYRPKRSTASWTIPAT